MNTTRERILAAMPGNTEEICERTGIKTRAARYWLIRLVNEGNVKRKLPLKDLRKVIYFVPEEQKAIR